MAECLESGLTQIRSEARHPRMPGGESESGAGRGKLMRGEYSGLARGV